MITPSPKHSYTLQLGCFATVATTPLFTSLDSSNNSMTAAVADPVPASSSLHCTRPSSVPASTMANGHRDILGFLSTQSTSPLQSPTLDEDVRGYTYSLATPPASCGQQTLSTLSNGGGMRQCLDTSVLQPHSTAITVRSSPVGSLLHHSVTISSPAALTTTNPTAAPINQKISSIASSPPSGGVTFRNFSPSESPTSRSADSHLPIHTPLTTGKPMVSSVPPLSTQPDSNRESNSQRVPLITAFYPDLVPRPEGGGSRLRLPSDVLVPDSPHGERRDYHNHLTDVVITLVDATGRVLYHRCHFLGQSNFLPESFQPNGTCWREHVNKLDWELWEGHFAEAVEEGARWYALTAQINASQFTESEAVDSTHEPSPGKHRDRYCRLLLDCPIYRARLGERWYFVHTLSLPIQLSTGTGVGDDPVETASDQCALVQLSCRTEAFCKPLIVHYHSILRECESETDVISGNAAASLRKAMLDHSTTVAWPNSSSVTPGGAPTAVASTHQHHSPIPVIRAPMTSAELLLDSGNSSKPSHDSFPTSTYAMSSPASSSAAASRLQGHQESHNIQSPGHLNACSISGPTHAQSSSPATTGTSAYSPVLTMVVTSSTAAPNACFSTTLQNTCFPPNRSLQQESSFTPSHMPLVVVDHHQQQPQQQQFAHVQQQQQQQHPNNHYYPHHPHVTLPMSTGPNHTHHYHHHHPHYVLSPDGAIDAQNEKTMTIRCNDTICKTGTSTSAVQRTVRMNTSEQGLLSNYPPVCQISPISVTHSPIHRLRNGPEQQQQQQQRVACSSSSAVASSPGLVFVDKVTTRNPMADVMTGANTDRLGTLNSSAGYVRVAGPTGERREQPQSQRKVGGAGGGGGKDQYGERIMRLQNLLPPEAIQRIRQIWQEIYGANKHSAASTPAGSTNSNPGGTASSATLREHFARRVRQVVRQYLGPNALVNLNRSAATRTTANSIPMPPPPSASASCSVSEPPQVVSSPQGTPSIICTADQRNIYGTTVTATSPHQPTPSQAISRSLVAPIPPVYTVPVICSTEPIKPQESKTNTMGIVHNTSTSPNSPSLVSMVQSPTSGPMCITSSSLAPPLELLPPPPVIRRSSCGTGSSSNSQCCVLEWLLSDEADLCLLPPSFYDGKTRGPRTVQTTNNVEGTVFMDMVSRSSMSLLPPSDTVTSQGALSIQLPVAVSTSAMNVTSSGVILVSPVTPIAPPPPPPTATRQTFPTVDPTQVAAEPTENVPGSCALQSSCCYSSTSSSSSGTSPLVSSSPIHPRSGSLLVRLLHPSTPSTMVSGVENRIPPTSGSEPPSPDVSLMRSDVTPRGLLDNNPNQHPHQFLTNARSNEATSSMSSSSPPTSTLFYQPSPAGSTTVLLSSSDPRGVSHAKRRRSGPPTPLLNISSDATALILNTSSTTVVSTSGSSRTRHISQVDGTRTVASNDRLDGLTSPPFTSLTQLLLQDFPTTTTPAGTTTANTPTPITVTTMTLNGCQMHPGPSTSDMSSSNLVSGSPIQRVFDPIAPRALVSDTRYSFGQSATTNTMITNEERLEYPTEPIDRRTSVQLSDPYNRQQQQQPHSHQFDSTNSSSGPFSDPTVAITDNSACSSSIEAKTSCSPSGSTLMKSSGPAQSSLCRLLLDPQLGPTPLLETSPMQTQGPSSSTISTGSTPLSPPSVVTAASRTRARRISSGGNAARFPQKSSGIDVYEFTATNTSMSDSPTAKPIESPTGRSMFGSTKTTQMSQHNNNNQPEQTFVLLNDPSPPHEAELGSTSSKVIAEEVEFLYEILRRDELERSNQDHLSNEMDNGTGSPRAKRSRGLSTPRLTSLSDNGSVERNEWIEGETRDADWRADDAQAVARICEQLQEGFTNAKPSNDPLPRSLPHSGTDSRTAATRSANFPEDIYVQTDVATVQDFPTSQDYEIGCVVHHPSSSPSSSSSSRPSGTQSSSSARGSLNEAAVAAARASQQAAATQRSQVANQRLLVEQRKRLIQHQMYNQVTLYSAGPNCAVPVDTEALPVSPAVIGSDPSVKFHRNTRTASGSSPPPGTSRSMAQARTRHASSSPIVNTTPLDGSLLNVSSLHGLHLTVTTVVSMSTTSPGTVSSRSTLPTMFYQHRPEDLPRYLKEVGPNVRVQLSVAPPAVVISSDRVPLTNPTGTSISIPRRPESADERKHAILTTPCLPPGYGVSVPGATSPDSRSTNLYDSSGRQLYSSLTAVREQNSAEIVMFSRNQVVPTTATMTTASVMCSVPSVTSPIPPLGVSSSSVCTGNICASPVQSENSYTPGSDPECRNMAKPSNSRPSKNGPRRVSTTSRSGNTARTARNTTSTTSLSTGIVSSSTSSSGNSSHGSVRIAPAASESISPTQFSVYKPITPAIGTLQQQQQLSTRWNPVNMGATYTSSSATPVSQIIAARTNSVCVGDGYVLGYMPVQSLPIRDQYPARQMYHNQQQQLKQFTTQQTQSPNPDMCIMPSTICAVQRSTQSPSFGSSLSTSTTPLPSPILPFTTTSCSSSTMLQTQSAFLYPLPTTGVVTEPHLLLPVQTNSVVAQGTQFYVLPPSQASVLVPTAISPTRVTNPRSVLSPVVNPTSQSPITTRSNPPPSANTQTRFDDRCATEVPRQTTADLLLISDSSNHLDAMFDVDSKPEESLLPDDIIDDVFGLETMVAAKQKQLQQERQNVSMYADDTGTSALRFAPYSPSTMDESDRMLGLHGLQSSSSPNASSSPSPCSPQLSSNLPADIRSCLSPSS